MDPYFPPPNNGLDVIYQDDYLLVLNKPSGLLSVPGKGEDKQDSLVSRVQAEFPDALNVHRLDMETSGIIVMARGKEVHRQLSMMFEARKTSKCYIAVVAGELEQSEGEIDLPLICDWPNRPRQMVDHERGKPSQTRYRVLSYDSVTNSSRVELEPITGRSHQLRVHMIALGHPILGDRLYGTAELATRLLLHASNLSFIHPVFAKSLDFYSQPDF